MGNSHLYPNFAAMRLDNSNNDEGQPHRAAPAVPLK